MLQQPLKSLAGPLAAAHPAAMTSAPASTPLPEVPHTPAAVVGNHAQPSPDGPSVSRLFGFMADKQTVPQAGAATPSAASTIVDEVKHAVGSLFGNNKTPAGPASPANATAGQAVTSATGPTTAVPAPVANHTPDDMKKLAFQTLVQDEGQRGLGGLTQALKNPSYSDADKAELIKEMIRASPELAAHELSLAGTAVNGGNGDMDPKDAKIVAKYLGQGYDENANDPAKKDQDTYGKLSPSDLKALIDPKNLTGAGNADLSVAVNPVGISNLISSSDAKGLQIDASQQMLAIAQSDKSSYSDNSAYYLGAAQAASGSPDAAQALLKTIGNDGLESFMDKTRPRGIQNRGDTMYDPSLGNFIAAAGNIKADPSDADMVKLKNRVFDLGVARVDGDPSMKEGLAKYFETNIDDVTTRLSADPKGADNKDGTKVDRETTMVNFVQNVMFSNDEFEGQKDLQSAFGTNINSRVASLQKYDGANTDSGKEQREKARELGLLVGSTEVGFDRALNDANDKNKQREAFAGMLVDATYGLAAGALPIPDSLKDAPKDKIKEWAAKWADEEVPDAKKLIEPLYNTASGIDGDLSTEMEAKRSSVFLDEHYGYDK